MKRILLSAFVMCNFIGVMCNLIGVKEVFAANEENDGTSGIIYEYAYDGTIIIKGYKKNVHIGPEFGVGKKIVYKVEPPCFTTFTVDPENERFRNSPMFDFDETDEYKINAFYDVDTSRGSINYFLGFGPKALPKGNVLHITKWSIFNEIKYFRSTFSEWLAKCILKYDKITIDPLADNCKILNGTETVVDCGSRYGALISGKELPKLELDIKTDDKLPFDWLYALKNWGGKAKKLSFSHSDNPIAVDVISGKNKTLYIAAGGPIEALFLNPRWYWGVIDKDIEPVESAVNNVDSVTIDPLSRCKKIEGTKTGFYCGEQAFINQKELPKLEMEMPLDTFLPWRHVLTRWGEKAKKVLFSLSNYNGVDVVNARDKTLNITAGGPIEIYGSGEKMQWEDGVLVNIVDSVNRVYIDPSSKCKKIEGTKTGFYCGERAYISKDELSKLDVNRLVDRVPPETGKYISDNWGGK